MRRFHGPLVAALPAPLGRVLLVHALTETVSLDGATTASIDIARLGTMTVLPNSNVTLNATASAKHLLQLDRGSMRVRVWAPPSRVVVSTPAGDVIDLGCVFTLSVVAGTAHITVETGWVQLENGTGEVLVPADGATWTDHRQPGSYLAFPRTTEPRRTISNLPFSKTRTRSLLSFCL